MKICFVSESPLPWGGTSAREIEFMQALVQGGHEVHAIFNSISEEGKALRKMEGVKVHNHRSKLFKKADENLEILSGALNIQYYFKKINELKDEMDVFHFSNHSRAFLGAFYKEIFDFPSVASLHNSATSDFFERGYPSRRDLKYFKFRISKDLKERTLAPHHEVILFPTKKGKNHFLKKYSHRLEGKCLAVPNPIDPMDVEQFKKKSLRITERNPVIGRFTNPRGGEERNKDLREIIIPKVTTEFPNGKFLLIGKKPPPEKRIDSKYVKYTGYVDDLDDVFKKLQVGIVTGHVSKGGGFRSRGTEFVKRGIPLVGYPPGAIRPSWGFAEEKGAVELKKSPEKIAEVIIEVLKDKEKMVRMNEACFESAGELYYNKVVSTLDQSFRVAIKEFEDNIN